jgi:hypothetical protein
LISVPILEDRTMKIKVFQPGLDCFSLGFRADGLYCLCEQGFINPNRYLFYSHLLRTN